MPTVLRISGPYEQLRHAIQSVSIQFAESLASRKTRQQVGSTPDSPSTFNFTVSDFDGLQVPAQLEESAQFLSQNVDIIEELQTLPSVESLWLDFSWEFPSNSVAQFNRFPSTFLKQCASLNIDIQVSVFSAAENDLPHEQRNSMP